MSHITHADLGGEPNTDPVLPEPEGELFHAAWEPRVLALTLAMGATGSWNLDMSRAAREALPDYARLSYYEIWFDALQRLLDERGLLQPDAPPLPRVLRADAVPAVPSATIAARPTSAPAVSRCVRLVVGVMGIVRSIGGVCVGAVVELGASVRVSRGSWPGRCPSGRCSPRSPGCCRGVVPRPRPRHLPWCSRHACGTP